MSTKILTKNEALALMAAELLLGDSIPEYSCGNGSIGLDFIHNQDSYQQIIDSLSLMSYGQGDADLFADICDIDDYSYCVRFYNRYYSYHYLLTV